MNWHLNNNDEFLGKIESLRENKKSFDESPSRSDTVLPFVPHAFENTIKEKERLRSLSIGKDTYLKGKEINRQKTSKRRYRPQQKPLELTDDMMFVPPLFPNKPVAEQTTKMLYSGLSAEGEGRASYLRERRLADPQDKFVVPVTSAQEVGWNRKNEIERPKKGKQRVVRTLFFRKNKIFYSTQLSGGVLNKMSSF